MNPDRLAGWPLLDLLFTNTMLGTFLQALADYYGFTPRFSGATASDFHLIKITHARHGVDECHNLRPTGFTVAPDLVNVTSSTNEVAMTFTVAIDGRITVNTSAEMRRKLLAALRSRPGQITLDLSRATYMDSSGVATLLEATHIARSQSTRIVLAGVSGQPRSLLAVANLDRLFEFAPQEKDE